MALMSPPLLANVSMFTLLLLEDKTDMESLLSQIGLLMLLSTTVFTPTGQLCFQSKRCAITLFYAGGT